jgi:hypothetical protein
MQVKIQKSIFAGNGLNENINFESEVILIPRFDSGNPKNLKKTQENLFTTKIGQKIQCDDTLTFWRF